MISHKLLIGVPSLFLALEIIKTLPFGELGRRNRKDNVLFNNVFVPGEKYIYQFKTASYRIWLQRHKECDKECQRSQEESEAPKQYMITWGMVKYSFSSVIIGSP